MNKPTVQDWMYLAINLLYILWVVSEQENSEWEDVEIRVLWKTSRFIGWCASRLHKMSRTLDQRVDTLLERRRTV